MLISTAMLSFYLKVQVCNAHVEILFLFFNKNMKFTWIVIFNNVVIKSVTIIKLWKVVKFGISVAVSFRQVFTREAA